MNTINTKTFQLKETPSKRILQLHKVFATGFSSPNRGANGECKTAILGAVTRQRISGQRMKRDGRIKTHELISEDPLLQDAQRSYRTSNLLDLLREHLSEASLGLIPEGKKEKKALNRKITDIFFSVYSNTPAPAKAKKEKEETAEEADKETGQMIYISGKEIEMLAKTLNEANEPKEGETPIFSSPTKDWKKIQTAFEKNLLKVAKNWDTATHGRMSTGMTQLNIESPMKVAHALSIGEVFIEGDFYVQTPDEECRSEDNAGAGFVGGTQEACASVFYGYTDLDIRQLHKNLVATNPENNLSPEAFARIVRLIAEAHLISGSDAKSGTMFGHCPIIYANISILSKGSNYQYIDSFLEPVDSEIKTEAVVRLQAAQKISKRLGNKYTQEIEFLPEGENTLEEIGEAIEQEVLNWIEENTKA